MSVLGARCAVDGSNICCLCKASTVSDDPHRPTFPTTRPHKPSVTPYLSLTYRSVFVFNFKYFLEIMYKHFFSFSDAQSVFLLLLGAVCF